MLSESVIVQVTSNAIGLLSLLLTWQRH